MVWAYLFEPKAHTSVDLDKSTESNYVKCALPYKLNSPSSALAHYTDDRRRRRCQRKALITSSI